MFVLSHKYPITITKNHIAIGCEMHEIKHWSKHIKEIGEKYGYTDNEIRGTILILKGLLLSRKD